MRRLTRKEKHILYHWKCGTRIEFRLKQRAALIWALFLEYKSVQQTAQEHQVCVKTVRKWRNRFRQLGTKGLHDRPRSGRPSVFDAAQCCEVIAMACDHPAAYGYATRTVWTMDLLTEACRVHIQGPAMSRSSIHGTLQRHDLHPHRHRMWLHSKDPQFREKANAIVSLYLEPPQDAVVLCVDEKTGMQALERRTPRKSARPGQPGRMEYEYVRHGTRCLFAAFNIVTGEVTAQCSVHRKEADILAFMEQVARRYPDKRVIVIWDNLNIHLDGPKKRWTDFNRRHQHRFSFYYTPLHASWVNQVELFFSIVHKRCLRYGDFQSPEQLAQQVMAFIGQWNQGEGHPFRWTFRGYPVQTEHKEAS